MLNHVIADYDIKVFIWKLSAHRIIRPGKNLYATSTSLFGSIFNGLNAPVFHAIAEIQPKAPCGAADLQNPGRAFRDYFEHFPAVVMIIIVNHSSLSNSAQSSCRCHTDDHPQLLELYYILSARVNWTARRHANFLAETTDASCNAADNALQVEKSPEEKI